MFKAVKITTNDNKGRECYFPGRIFSMMTDDAQYQSFPEWLNSAANKELLASFLEKKELSQFQFSSSLLADCNKL